MKINLFGLLSIIALLAGCANEQPARDTRVWYKPGVTSQQAQQDLATARAYARSEPTSFAGMVGYINIYMGNHGYILATPSEIETLKAGPSNSHGLSLKDARDRSLHLNPAMTQPEVEAIMGKPDATEAGTYGQKSGTGVWQGVQWHYEFETDSTVTILSITFQMSDQWRINNWSWYPD